MQAHFSSGFPLILASTKLGGNHLSAADTEGTSSVMDMATREMSFLMYLLFNMNNLTAGPIFLFWTIYSLFRTFAPIHRAAGEGKHHATARMSALLCHNVSAAQRCHRSQIVDINVRHPPYDSAKAIPM